MKSLDAIASEVSSIAKLSMQEERAAVVAWLRAEAYLTLYEASPWQVSDAIERGDHRPEVT
jgi:hypothetical protein